MDFKVKIRYAVTSYSTSVDECHFSPNNEFSNWGQNIWFRLVNGIWIEMKDEDIEFEPKTGGRFLNQKHKIVKAFYWLFSDTVQLIKYRPPPLAPSKQLVGNCK